MRYLIAALLTISCLYIKAQDAEVVLWTENVDGEIVIFGKNRETAPYTAVLTIGGENIIAQDQSPMMVVLPGGSENQ